MNHMDEIDRRVAEILNEKHKKEMKRKNQGEKKLPPLKVGDKVWYRRPENTGTKLDTRWIGPAKITAREGEESYENRTSGRDPEKGPQKVLETLCGGQMERRTHSIVLPQKNGPTRTHTAR